MQALQSASVNAAELLKIDDYAGSIEADKLADFIIIEENPLENIKAVQGDKIVYKKKERKWNKYKRSPAGPARLSYILQVQFLFMITILSSLLPDLLS